MNSFIPLTAKTEATKVDGEVQLHIAVEEVHEDAIVTVWDEGYGLKIFLT